MDEARDEFRDEALAFYKTVQTYENHFNGLEFEVRKLASTWLLASFAAIAFLIRGDLQEPKSLIGTVPLIVIVSALAQVGLFILWILDQVVYHGLLDAAFSAALHIERRYSELPPLRSLMMRISAGDESGKGGTGMARYLKLFYVIPMAAFAILAWTATWLGFQRGTEIFWMLVGLSVFVSMLPIWVLVKTRRIDAGKAHYRPSAAGDFKDRPYDLAADRWLQAMDRRSSLLETSGG